MSVEHDAITAFVQDCEPGSIVTKFVVVAEVIGSDGQRGVWTATHDGAEAWDSIGLLAYAMGQVECSGEGE